MYYSFSPLTESNKSSFPSESTPFLCLPRMELGSKQ